MKTLALSDHLVELKTLTEQLTAVAQSFSWEYVETPTGTSSSAVAAHEDHFRNLFNALMTTISKADSMAEALCQEAEDLHHSTNPAA